MTTKSVKLLIIVIFVVVSFSPVFAQKRIKEIQGNAGQRWAVCIGINDYKDKRIVDLKNARNDAKVMAEALKGAGQFDNVVVMTDDLAPADGNFPQKNTVMKKLTDLKAQIKPEDLVLFFFSGHGISDAAGDGFLVLANSYRENLSGTSLKIKDVIKWLNEMGVKKSILLLDASRKRFLTAGAKIKGAAMQGFAADQQGAVFYSAKPGEFGYDDTGANVGAFTAFVIDGLKGHADKNGGNGDGVVSFSELGNFIKNGVSKWAANKQNPDTKVFNNLYAGLALSSYASLPSELSKSLAAPGGVGGAVTAISLRSVAGTLKNEGITVFLKKHGFYDKGLNPGGDFKNGFESKDLNGDKVVVDRATGLMWHAAGSEVHMELSKAKEWIAAINGRKYAGFADWRLPTLEEAASLVENSAKNGSLYIDPAFSAAQKSMWSADVASSEVAWAIALDQGKIVRDYNFNYFFIRPVRSNK